MNTEDKIKKACDDFNSTWDPKEFYKLKHAQINCIKTSLLITSSVWDRHKTSYNKIKNSIYPNWRNDIKQGAIIKWFLCEEMELIPEPKAGAFLFLPFKKTEIIFNVGVCLNSKEYYVLNRNGLVLKKIADSNYRKIGFIYG